MNKQEKILAYVVIGIVGLAGIVVGVNSQIANADLTKGEVFNYITEYTSLNADVFDRLIGNSDTVEELEDAIRLLEDDHNDVLNELEESMALALATVRNEIAQLKIDVAILNAGGLSGGGGSTSNADFDLESCMDYNCTDETSRFNQDDIVYVRGDNPTNDRSLEYRVYDPDGDRIKSGNVNMSPNSPFIFTFSIDDDAEDGTYEIRVEIDNDVDTINFIVD
jgi:hypothetical protein